MYSWTVPAKTRALMCCYKIRQFWMSYSIMVSMPPSRYVRDSGCRSQCVCNLDGLQVYLCFLRLPTRTKSHRTFSPVRHITIFHVCLSNCEGIRRFSPLILPELFIPRLLHTSEAHYFTCTQPIGKGFTSIAHARGFWSLYLTVPSTYGSHQWGTWPHFTNVTWPIGGGFASIAYAQDFYLTFSQTVLSTSSNSGTLARQCIHWC